jgi:hypothetical protein
MTRTTSILTPALAVLVFAGGTAFAERGVEEEIHQHYETGADARLSLKNLNGEVRVQGWDKNVIEVTAVKSASGPDRLDDATVHFDFEDDHLRINVEYEGDDWNHRDDFVSVDFVIRVPRGARIDAIELVNGDVELRDVLGEVEASSVNGEVDGEGLGGDIDLSTVNGEVSLHVSERAASIRLSSVNGGVSLFLTGKINADVEASTVHGSIMTADGLGGLEVDDSRFLGSSLKGTIGRGGMKIDLDTVNGSIEIRRESGKDSREREN